MQVIQASIEYYDDPNPMIKLERCARVCYKSEDKITESSADRLIRNILIKRGHESTLEHYRICAEIDRNDAKYFLVYPHIKLYYGNDNSTCTVSGNIRAWRDFCKVLRLVSVGTSMVAKLYQWCPALFEDLLEYFHITPETAKLSRSTFIRNIRQDLDYHTYVITTDIGVGREFCRHRSQSFSQESTRYCNYGNDIKFVDPFPFTWSNKAIDGGCSELEDLPNAWNAKFILEDTEENKKIRLHKHAVWVYAMKAAEVAYCNMLRLGCSPQEARSVLPLSTASTLVMSGTSRMWQNFLRLRYHETAHPQAWWMAKLIKDDLEERGIWTGWSENMHYNVEDNSTILINMITELPSLS